MTHLNTDLTTFIEKAEAALSTDHPGDGDWYFCQEQYRATIPPSVAIALARVAMAAEGIRYAVCDGYRTMQVSDDDFDAVMDALAALSVALEENNG